MIRKFRLEAEKRSRLLLYLIYFDPVIASYLKHKIDEGQLDSVGGFSLDVQSARRILGKSLFPDQEFCLLKLVQAANIAGCDFLKLSFGLRCLKLNFEGWGERGKVLSFSESRDLETANKFLNLALLGLEAINKSKAKISRHDRRMTVEVSLPLRSPSEHRSQREFLVEHARYSRVPILLGSERLNQPGPPHRFSRPVWNEFLPQGTVLCERDLPGGRGQIYLRIGLQRQAEIFFVKAGALIATVQTACAVRGIQAVVQADALDTDLTGLQLVQNEKYDECLRWLHASAQEMRQEVLNRIDQIEAENEPFSLQAKVRLNMHVSGGALAIVGAGAALLALTGDVVMGTFLLGSPLLTCASVATASLARSGIFEPGEASHQRLREQIRQRL